MEAIGHNPATRAECPSEGQDYAPLKGPAPRRERLSSKMTAGLRRSSKDLLATFAKGPTAGETGPINKSVSLRQSLAGCVPALIATQIVAEQRKDPDLLSVTYTPSGKGEELGEIETTWQDRDGTASTTCSEDVLALEVGRSAYEYLEECFYTEVSVLDREKFNAVPEIAKSDFTILGHLGRGSYSDVFEVACRGGRLRDAEARNAAPGRRRSLRCRRATLSSSVTTATLARPSVRGKPRIVFALKCLRPQIRCDDDQFAIGAEDLVHETAILANLNHRHIIKLHGRASGHLKDAFLLNDGYFILLDKLKETLCDRIGRWKQDPGCVLQGPTEGQLEVARPIADAMCYLHSKKIIFRDLKPANVGFDSEGVMKLFDFGFANGTPEKEPSNPSAFLYDRCGTPRYMAPEVGLSLGYGLPADIYSFGVLLWEICALAKPFASIQTADEFDRRVFLGGERPAVESRWPIAVKAIMNRCWSAAPSKRPTMLDVKYALSLMVSNRGGGEKAPLKAVQSRISRGRSEDGW